MIDRFYNIVWRRAYGVARDGAHLFRFLLALNHSRKLKNTRFVGITGSAGKTTTKDLAAAILASAGSCHSSPRSMNYPDGIAKILLNVKRKHDFCVLEVSGGAPNELDRPLRLFTPDIAVLTIIAKDHFKAFRSIDGIAAEKSKLIAALPEHGTAVLNIDDPQVRSIGEHCPRKVIWVGQAEGATLRLRHVSSRWPEPLTLQVEYESQLFDVKTRLYGEHLALAVMCALAVGLAAGLPLAQSIEALAAVKPQEGRMELVDSGDGVTFVRDDWKAPHWSLEAPLKFMADARAQRKVIVIGTLSDYSLSASKLYPKVAKQALKVGDLVVFVGPHGLRALKAQQGADDESLRAFSEIEEAGRFLAKALRPGDLVLLKGSNKADHLVRLYYDRKKPVQCWVSKCGIQDFCGDCSRLYRNPGAGTRSHVSEVIPLSSRSPDLGKASCPVVIGLGNPGSRFDNTPHNVGYRVLDALVRELGGAWETESEGVVCRTAVNDICISLFKPEISINRSGPVARRFMEKAEAYLDGCIIVHDDVDLPLGEVRVKHGGSDGGHKGVKSMIAALGSSAVTRVRIGVRIGGDDRPVKTAVLAPFSEADTSDLQRGLEQSVAAVLSEVKAKLMMAQASAPHLVSQDEDRGVA